MAGVATETTILKVTGLGNDVTKTNEKIITAPVAKQEGYTVLTAATTTALALFALVDHFALNKIYMVYIKAIVGTIYIKANTAGTATIGSGTATFVLKIGESSHFPVNPANNAGFVVDGDSVAAAIEWEILAKA